MLKKFNLSLPCHYLGDGIAGIVVALLLIPQGLAYAILAGLPPQMGLYASLTPLVAYALVGQSPTQSVGPMAVTSLLVGSVLARLAPEGGTLYIEMAIKLAILSGVILVVAGLVRLGGLIDYLSRPVLAAFISASALLIVGSQCFSLLGLPVHGATLIDWGKAILKLGHWVLPIHAFILGIILVLALLLIRRWGQSILCRVGLSAFVAQTLVRMGPLMGLALASLWVAYAQWPPIKMVGYIPAGLPHWVWPNWSWRDLSILGMPACLVGLVNFVQSSAIAQELAKPHDKALNPSREMGALGLANVVAGLSGGFPVTGGLTRSKMNADAGAESQMASVFAALGLGLVLCFATAYLAYIPSVALAAIILVSVVSMVDFSVFFRAWKVDRVGALAFAVTFLAVLSLGVEDGILLGVLLSLVAWIGFQSNQIHMPEIGLIVGSEHFRNRLHYQVKTLPSVLFLRIDSSLFFGNARRFEQQVLNYVQKRSGIQKVILVFSAVNRIDLTAIDRLGHLQTQLEQLSIQLDLAEVKVPILEKLKHSGFEDHFKGKVYLSCYQAWQSCQAPMDVEFHI